MTTPELDERRIDAMRSSIMHAVNVDVARRGRRTRRGLGILAAACFVVVIGGVGFSQLAVTGGGSDSGAARNASSADRDDALREDAGGKSAPNASEVAPQDAREVITTGNVNVTVDDPSAVAEQFAAWVEAASGRVDERGETDSEEGRAFAYLTVRVPSTQVSKAITKLGTYGDVGNVDLQNEDVTAQGQDLDARIKALEISIDRLQKILAGAGSSAEVVRAEDALTKRQEQLESLQAQRKSLSDQVALSTLRVELAQKGSAASVEPGGFQGGLTKGWNALVDTVNGIVSLAGVLAPWLAVALVMWILWRVARRVSRA